MGKSSVFVNKKAVIHKGSPGQSTVMPDVNLCPPSPPAGPVPTPLPNIARASELQNGAASVLVNGNPMANQSSYIGRSQGNAIARSTGGGVVSHAVEGQAHFLSGSPNVMVEGKPAVFHSSLLTHNHLAKSPGNTAPGCWLDSVDAGGVRAAAAASTRKTEPQTVEVYIDAPEVGDDVVDQTWELASTDGKWKLSVSTKSAGKEGTRRVVRFEKVPPGKQYSLWQVMGSLRVPVFQHVHIDQLAAFGIAGDAAPEIRDYEVWNDDVKLPRVTSSDPVMAERLRPIKVEMPDDWFDLDPERP